MHLYKANDILHQALMWLCSLETQAGVVGNRLVQGVAVGIVDFEQSSVEQRIQRISRAGSNGECGLFGEAVWFGREDRERIEGCTRLLVELLVADGDDRFERDGDIQRQ